MVEPILKVGPKLTSVSMNALFVHFSAVLICSLASVAAAQDVSLQTETEKLAEDSSWYGEPTSPVHVTPRMIIQQKAQLRAQQRIARMESLKWYGFSASRPLYNATPFTGIPSPRYEMPGGRPFAWYPYSGASVIIVR